MPNTVIQLKKSATVSAKPSDLANGELAINFADGKLFYKNTAGFIAEISGAGTNSFGTVNANGTLVVSDTSGDVLTLIAGSGINITGDAVNDRITFSGDTNIAEAAFAKANAALPNTTNAVFNGNLVISQNLRFVGSNTRVYSTSDTFYITNGAQTNKQALVVEAGAGTGGILVGRGAFNATFGNDTGNRLNITSTNWGGVSFSSVGSLNHSANNGLFRFSGDANSYGASNGVIQVIATSSVGYYVRFTKDDLTPSNSARPNDVFTVSYAGDIVTSGNTRISGSLSVSGADILTTIAGANTAVGEGANTYLLATIAGANTAVGTGANTYILSVIAGANVAVGTGANTYLLATISGANTAVGTGANTYLLTTLTGANTAVGTAANNFATATIAGANAAVGIGANTFAAAAAAGANAYMISVQDGSNTAVGTGANTYLLTTLAGANVAVGTGANTYLLTTLAGANTAVGTGANAFASATIAGANTAVGAGANNYANSTFVKLTAGSQTITGDLAIVGNLTLSGNTVFIDATRLQIDDPLIYLAGNNYSSDIVDIGFIGNYVNSTGQNVHTGLFRDHTTKEYYLFHSYDQEPINNHIDPTGNNLTLAVLNSAVRTSNLVLGGANLLTTLAGSNAAVGTGANAFASATIAGSNTAVGTGANTVGSAAFAKANAALANTTGTFNGTLTVAGNFSTTGNVGIGRTDPGFRLDVVGTINASNVLINGNSIGAGGGASVAISDSAPTSPSANSLWWSSDLGKMFIYYNDGSSNQWVETSPSPDTTEIFSTANSARDIAVLSFNRANSAQSTAIAAFSSTNTTSNVAISSFTRANSAQTIAVSAFNSANTAVTTGKAIAMAIVFG